MASKYWLAVLSQSQTCIQTLFIMYVFTLKLYIICTLSLLLLLLLSLNYRYYYSYYHYYYFYYYYYYYLQDLAIPAIQIIYPTWGTIKEFVSPLDNELLLWWIYSVTLDEFWQHSLNVSLSVHENFFQHFWHDLFTQIIFFKHLF